MNVATGRELLESHAVAQLCAQEPVWGTHPSAPRPRGPSSGEAHLAPTWGLHPGVSLQASSPPSSLSSKTPWPCLPAQKLRGCAPPGSCFFSGCCSLPGADHDPLCPPQPDCHLHLHLRWADNPYVSGTVHTKDSAPGLIMGAGRRPQESHCPCGAPVQGGT